MKKPITFFLLISIFSCTQQNRPQEPEPPYPYSIEEVKFENETDGAILAGTLTKPTDDKIKATVILVSGSGLQDRDETVYGHKPFLVLADYLTLNNIAVLRYDDRGVGESKGKLIGSTTETFAGDTYAGIEYLYSRKDIPNSKIGIIGHSEGGLIATLLASQYKNISFVVLLGSPGIPFDEVLISSNENKLRKQGKSEEIVQAGTDLFENLFVEIKKDYSHNSKKKKLAEIISKWKSSLKGEAKEDIDQFISENPQWFDYVADEWATPWFCYAMNFDPKPYLQKVQCPVLALIGDKDCQVLAHNNLPIIRNALIEGGNSNFKIESLENINHIFQMCNTGFRDEYKLIEETFNENVMKMISDWIVHH